MHLSESYSNKVKNCVGLVCTQRKSKFSDIRYFVISVESFHEFELLKRCLDRYNSKFRLSIEVLEIQFNS